MVNVMENKSGLVYLCEICGHGYRELGKAESYEEFCDFNQSSTPRDIRKAVYRPSTQVIPITAT
jgi:hypothetical protein